MSIDDAPHSLEWADGPVHVTQQITDQSWLVGRGRMADAVLRRSNGGYELSARGYEAVTVGPDWQTLISNFY